jgi:hypothetical protein
LTSFDSPAQSYKFLRAAQFLFSNLAFFIALFESCSEWISIDQQKIIFPSL